MSLKCQEASPILAMPRKGATALLGASCERETFNSSSSVFTEYTTLASPKLGRKDVCQADGVAAGKIVLV